MHNFLLLRFSSKLSGVTQNFNLVPKKFVGNSFQNSIDTWCQNCLVWLSDGCCVYKRHTTYILGLVNFKGSTLAVYCLWGLAGYSVHTTATCSKFLNITHMAWNYQDRVFLVSLDLEGQDHTKIQLWNITHHASHSTLHILHMIFF